MADIQAGVGRDFSIVSADQYKLNNASDGYAGTIAIQLVSASFSGSVSITARVHRGGQTNATAFVACNYVSIYLNGSVSDQTYKSTAITTTSLILVPATGLDIAINCTSFVSGALNVTWSPATGSAA